MASQIGTIFGEFVANERELYEDKDNNKVAMSLSQVTRYLRFVDIVHSQYLEVNESCVQANRRRLDEAKQQSGTRNLTAEEIDQLRQEAEWFERLHLEIESFFIFTTIALDKIAHFVEDYFGYAHNGPSLKSHHNWCKYATEFAGKKNIQLPDQMLSTMERLQDQVVDHRDKQVAHQRNPRTLFGTVTAADGAAQIAAFYLYPCDSESQKESPHIDDVLTNLEAYVKQLMNLIIANRTKSRYKYRPR